jgi:hypothetical protein
MSHSSEDSNLCETGHRMEVILHEGQCWFRAADVTRWLRYRNGRQVVLRCVKSKDKTTKEFLVEGGGHSTFINENGLRGLLKRCQRLEADDLQVWVASEMDNLRTSFSRCQLKSLIVHLTPRPPSDPQDDVAPRLLVYHGEFTHPRAREGWTECLSGSESQATLCWTTLPGHCEALVQH